MDLTSPLQLSLYKCFQFIKKKKERKKGEKKEEKKPHTLHVLFRLVSIKNKKRTFQKSRIAPAFRVFHSWRAARTWRQDQVFNESTKDFTICTMPK